ncbi:MAG: sugar ABC transporter ATP-binding protein [Eubacterium sp.]|nr:sugar ABC transporter ATP-binding protein [Eubacterium sp.]
MQNKENILEMKAIDKFFPGVKALDKVDFSVKEGEVHCLIGANGAGKSTLMKVLSGAYKEDGGEIWFNGEQLKPRGTLDRRNKGIAVIYQELSLFNDLDVAENVFIGNYPRTGLGTVDWKELYRKTDELIASLNIDIKSHSKVSDLSIGHRQMTEIMKALACNAKLIVMDEPSSTLSMAEFEILKRVIADLTKKGITIIFISHHLEELFIVGERVTVMRDGKFVTCQNLKDITIDELVEFMTGAKVEKKDTVQEKRELSDEVVLEVKHLKNSKVDDINMKLHKGEILGMYGLVGAGRTETVRSIYGADPFTGGEILLNGKPFRAHSPNEAIRNRIGLMPENRKGQGLVLLLPVWENITMVSLPKFKQGGAINYGKIGKECEEYKKQLDIKTPSIKTQAVSLSGGNQQKVIFAKWLSEESDILIIDEPTQGIDVMVKKEIYKIIKRLSEEGKSIIVISSELDELLSVCDNIIVMYDGKQIMMAERGSFDSEKILQASITGRA